MMHRRQGQKKVLKKAHQAKSVKSFKNRDTPPGDIPVFSPTSNYRDILIGDFCQHCQKALWLKSESGSSNFKLFRYCFEPDSSIYLDHILPIFTVQFVPDKIAAVKVGVFFFCCVSYEDSNLNFLLFLIPCKRKKQLF